MPIAHKHIMYGCQFKCGNDHTLSYEATKNHELRCWYNPDNKTCKSCRFEEYGLDNQSVTITRWCTAPNGEDIIKAKHDEIYVGRNVKPVEHCEAWEPI